MDSFEQENFIRANQFEAFINTVERVFKEHEIKIVTVNADLVSAKTELDNLKKRINELSIFQFIKLKLKKKPIC